MGNGKNEIAAAIGLVTRREGYIAEVTNGIGVFEMRTRRIVWIIEIEACAYITLVDMVVEVGKLFHSPRSI